MLFCITWNTGNNLGKKNHLYHSFSPLNTGKKLLDISAFILLVVGAVFSKFEWNADGFIWKMAWDL